MNLTKRIHQFIDQPFPPWETKLTHQLVQHQWAKLNAKGFVGPHDYSTARIWLNNPNVKLEKKLVIAENKVCVEMPSIHLQSFYDEHGLELLPNQEIETNEVLTKLDSAFSILRLIKPAYDCITDLVQSIHILKQSDDEVDLSYSHPKIPLSIFVSVCENKSPISNLRVAESILHETMHLKLTLIENHVPLVKFKNNAFHYSPWKAEKRPVQGVLHGLFVFKTIANFYRELLEKKLLKGEDQYLSKRIYEITEETSQLENFSANSCFTEAGANLAESLLP